MRTLLPTPGEVIWIRQRRWRVQRASRHRGVVRLDVAARQEQLTFLAPFDRPSTTSPSERPRRVRRSSALARLAHLVSRSHGVRTLFSAVGADVALLPYQLEPALAMAHGARRVLVADEVGLGKTIQAGVVIAEMARRLPSCRILIVVPAALVAQWRDELQRRFRVLARTADRGHLDALTRAGGRRDNPWRRRGVWVTSDDFVKQPHILATLPPHPWDLIVFDEAHRVCGSSERHAAADGLAKRARQLLLLTATPHDGDEARFQRLIELGSLADELTVFRRTKSILPSPRPRRIRWHRVTLSGEEHRVLNVLREYERAVLAAAGTGRRNAALLLLSVFRKRAVSTMSALAISLERRQKWIARPAAVAEPEWLQPSLGFHDWTVGDDLGDEGAASITADVGLDPHKERAWLNRLSVLVLAARRRERKVMRLVKLLRRSREPVVVFTEFRHSLDALHRQVSIARSVATLHGGQTAAERTQQLARFLDGSASVLLATDVASLGLNLQHRARWAISLELPWNPARLEQRLGRIDRIGQTRPVHFTLLVAAHDAERTILSRLAHRAVIARRAIGPDALRGIDADAAVREEVIAGLPQAPSVSDKPVVPICHRWARVARVAARTLARRRQFAARWQSPEADHGRPRIALVPHRVATWVFTAPIVDTSGAVLEEHAVAVRMPDARGGTPSTAQTEAGRDAVAGHLIPRAARVGRWLQCRQRDQAARDRAITAVIEATAQPAEVQPGLFNRRALRALEAARDAVTDLRSDVRSIAAGDQPATAVVGRPRLALILVPARLRVRTTGRT